MDIKYDGEWITQEINDSMVLNLVDDKMHLYSSYEAIDLINALGDDIRIGLANVNDLNNLLLYGVMRFKALSHDKEYVDIPIRNIYKLYEKANIMKLNSSQIDILNERKYISDLDAFMVIDGKQVIDNRYSFISTIINDSSEELKELLTISKEYGLMDMNEKFVALTKVDVLNHVKEKR